MASTDAPTPEITGTWGDWAADKVIRGLIGTALRLPWHRRVPFMGAALARVIGPIVGYRRRALANLALIRPDLPLSERQRIAREVLDNFGRTLIENYAWQAFGAHLQNLTPTGPGLAALEQAARDGRPVIFVTGHFGNFEVPRQVLTRMGYRIGGLYRAMDNPYFNAHYAPTMTGMSGPVFEKGPRGTMGFARHLRAGGMATILFDIHDIGGEPIPFLGRPAWTAVSAATLALRFNAVVIPYFATRLPDGLQFEVVIEAPIPATDPVTMTKAMSDRLAAHVIAHPEQWFWVHRRWKAGRKPYLG
jgi:Kdo2-lipid IVA lauroyltransferase/acyltransferase